MIISAFADEAAGSLSGQIEALRANLICGLEIRGVDGKNINELSLSETKEIKRKLDWAGITVTSIGSPIGKIPLDGDVYSHFEDFRRIIEKAYILGAPYIRIFSFYPAEGKGKGDVFANMEKMLSLTPENITLCHENEKGIFGDNAETCRELLDAFPRLRAVFDPANFVQCGVDTKYAWDMLRERTEYLHIKDALADGTVVPAGEGIGNLPFIISDYIACGGKLMTLEPHLMDFIGLGALENGKNIYLGKRYKDNASAFSAAAKSLFDIINAIK